MCGFDGSLRKSSIVFLTFFNLLTGWGLLAGAQCTLNPASPSVTICTPAPNSTVTSPVHVVAGTTSSTTVQYIQIYVDGVKKFEVKGKSLDTTLAMTAGVHRLTVQAFNGAYFKTVESITASSATTASVTVTPDSTLVSPGATRQFTAQVKNLSSSTVSWAVDGIAGGSASSGTISSSGLYTAPSTSHKHVITATSTANATVKGSSKILVQT